MSLFGELKRRNVFRVGAAYILFAWLVIQVVETIFPAFGFDDGAIRTVTIVFGIGFIPVLIFAWVFELTAEGLKKESQVDRTRPASANTRKRMDQMIMVIMALALSYFAVDKFLLTPSAEPPVIHTSTAAPAGTTTNPFAEDASIVVLPFRNISPDPENEYFADGMTEELLTLLANVPELRVISRSSSFTFKDRTVPIAQIAEQLRVAYVLEGSVRKAEDVLRISVQLIDARSDDQQWSNTWERPARDIFDLQNTVASEIVDQLQSSFNIGDFARREQPTENLEAYNVYLRARELWWRRDSESVARSIDLFEKSIEMDPEFALAHAGLASALYIDWLSNPLRDDDEWWQRARRANELDEALGEPVLLMGDYVMDELDPAGGVAMVRLAVALEPNSAWINHMVSINYAAGGGLLDSLTLAEKAQALDPLQGIINANLGKAHLLLGNNDSALRYLDIAAELGVENDVMWASRSLVHARRGDLAAARATAELAAEAMGFSASYIPLIAGLADESSMPEFELSDLDELPVLLKYIVCLRADELDCALDAITARMSDRSNLSAFSMIWLEEARLLRRDPKFMAWLMAMNWPALSAYWTFRGWPDACPKSEEFLDCS